MQPKSFTPFSPQSGHSQRLRSIDLPSRAHCTSILNSICGSVKRHLSYHRILWLLVCLRHIVIIIVTTTTTTNTASKFRHGALP
jgi:hypothetical protein